MLKGNKKMDSKIIDKGILSYTETITRDYPFIVVREDNILDVVRFIHPAKISFEFERRPCSMQEKEITLISTNPSDYTCRFKIGDIIYRTNYDRIDVYDPKFDNYELKYGEDED